MFQTIRIGIVQVGQQTIGISCMNWNVERDGSSEDHSKAHYD